MITRFIGDVHGKYEQYKKIIKDAPPSIQVGDMGVGFRHTQGPNVGEMCRNPPHYAMVASNARFIRGNHDNPGVCRGHSQWIRDGHFENGIMFMGGADSIDKQYRIEGYTWWPDEELSISELNNMVDLYIERKPNIIVTHDCPELVAQIIMASGQLNYFKFMASRTRQAFQGMLSAHSPKLWIFGHHHISFDHTLCYDGNSDTRFICLGELEYKDIDINEFGGG
jgi:Calcineurin-like phosphoesterase